MASVAQPTAVGTRSVVSHLSRLRSPRGQADPFPVYRRLRALGPVLPTPWGGHLVTRYDLCDQVLRGRDWHTIDAEWKARQSGDRWTGFAHQELSRTLQGLNSPHHPRHRRSIGNVFDRATLAELHGTVAGSVDGLLDTLVERIRDGEEPDFGAVVGDQLPIEVIGAWLDLPRADYPLLLWLTHEHVVCQELLPTPTDLASADNAAQGLRLYFTALVHDRRLNPGNDVISRWLRVWDELESDPEAAEAAVFYLVMFLFVAAVETTATLLPTMVWLLDQHPDQRRLLLADPGLVPGAVEEVLRYDPPIHMAGRVASRDMELGGVTVTQDSMVHLMIGSANHDPDHIVEPDVFDIRRQGNQLSMHLAFGGGAHYCVGAALARQEATELLRALTVRLPGLRVSTPPTWSRRVAFRRMTGMRVREG
ncbi:cytochrome P450 [Streptomyces sp. SM14]|uniref:cytochrome P450 n=1 Tax=Streptomyces sp. SM14 TaxID=1736045 RepID=UPI000CD56F81|nr:cytochrome P450 [Streptomyces sp. SM14]